MGNTRKKKKINVVTKSQSEAQSYRMAVTRSLYSPEPTTRSSNGNLRGSNEISADDLFREDQQQSVPTPKLIKLHEWLKANTWELVVGVVFFAVLGWLCISIIDLKIQTAELAVRLEYIKQDIEKLESDSASKEILDFEIRNIEKALEQANILSIQSLESRIQILEEQLTAVSDSD